MQISDSSLGPYLRAEREQQGIDLQDVAELTKIQPKFIEAIEDDAYDRLPKGPFVIGFLRSYAECLSIDADEVVTFYQARFGATTPSTTMSLEHAVPVTRPVSIEHPMTQDQSAREPSGPLRRRGMLWVGMVGLACVLIYAVWNERSGPPITPASDPSTANEAPIAQSIASTPAAPVVATPAASRSASTPSDLVTHPVTTPAATGAPQVDAAPSDQPIILLSEASAPALAPLVLRVYAIEQYCGQNLGRLFGNNTIVAKGFVLRAGFFQTQPVS